MYIHNTYYPYLENYSLYYIILIAYLKKRSHIDAGTTNTYISTLNIYTNDKMFYHNSYSFLLFIRECLIKISLVIYKECWVILN